MLRRYKGRLHIHAELKGHSPLLAQQTAALIRRYGMTEQVTVTSFQKQRLYEIRAAAPELQTGWLIEEMNDAVLSEAHALGLTQVCPNADMLTPDMVQRLHAEGFVVRVWGVKTEEQMRLVVEAGANGMTVNFPGSLIAYLASRGFTWT